VEKANDQRGRALPALSDSLLTRLDPATVAPHYGGLGHVESRSAATDADRRVLSACMNFTW
jgi:hypothetical protein